MFTFSCQLSALALATVASSEQRVAGVDTGHLPPLITVQASSWTFTVVLAALTLAPLAGGRTVNLFVA